MPGFDREVVREASSEDGEAICAIYNAALAERSSTFETAPRSAVDFTERIADPRYPLLVGDAGQGVLGWAGLAPYSTRACYSGIGECSVYVSPDARGQGLGTALTKALAAAAVDLGFHKMIGKLFTTTWRAFAWSSAAASQGSGCITGTGSSPNRGSLIGEPSPCSSEI